jgi:hypothetical protein
MLQGNKSKVEGFSEGKSENVFWQLLKNLQSYTMYASDVAGSLKQ